MIIHVLFGQRIETYEGEYAPEAIEVMDEYSHDDNPGWLDVKLKEYEQQKIYSRLEIVDIEIFDDQLDRIMKPQHKLEGEIKDKNKGEL